MDKNPEISIVVPVYNEESLVEELCSRLKSVRSEEHTSELQSRTNLVCRLLLEKKKNKNNTTYLHE